MLGYLKYTFRRNKRRMLSFHFHPKYLILSPKFDLSGPSFSEHDISRISFHHLFSYLNFDAKSDLHRK